MKVVRVWIATMVLGLGVANAADGVHVSGRGESVYVGYQKEFSTWSDLTAIFRPSRWGNPFKVGGTLSWLNPKAWGAEPGRTTKVLVGEAIVALAAYGVSEALDDDDGAPATPAETAQQPAASATSSSSSRKSSSSSQVETTAPVSSPVVPVPDPVEPPAGDESPW